MAPFAPFPSAPRIALALSGGADSLALLVLLLDWVAPKGGSVLALVVDHGLRPESAAEAAGAARLAERMGAESRVLTWRAPGSGSALQARARAARYRLLQAACRERGLLYLASAHHREDQAETFLLRLESGSGLAGLAGMSAVTVLQEVLLLRPLLPVPRARLRALLEARGLRWVEDPSNRDARFRRVAMRRLEPHLACQGLGGGEIADSVSALGRLRHHTERRCLAWLAEACAWRPEGYAVLEPAALEGLEAPLLGRALGEVLKVIGGAAYAPAPERVAALLADFRDGRGSTTLGGCRLLRRGGRVLVLRESRGPKPLALKPGVQDWDRRFRLRCGPALPPGLRLACLSEQGRRRMEAGAKAHRLPAAVIPSLPAVWDELGPLAVPPLGWQRRECEALDLSLKFHPHSRPGSNLFSVA